jgi:hypothetical protein
LVDSICSNAIWINPLRYCHLGLAVG